MKTQNTTFNTAAAFAASISSVGTIAGHALPAVAANEASFDTDSRQLELANEVAYWMIVAAAFSFQLLLVNLLASL